MASKPPKHHRRLSSWSNALTCDECYTSFELDHEAKICANCHLLYCESCVRSGIFLKEDGSECENCSTGKLSMLDYVLIARYLLSTYGINGRKLADALRNNGSEDKGLW